MSFNIIFVPSNPRKIISKSCSVPYLLYCNQTSSVVHTSVPLSSKCYTSLLVGIPYSFLRHGQPGCKSSLIKMYLLYTQFPKINTTCQSFFQNRHKEPWLLCTPKYTSYIIIFKNSTSVTTVPQVQPINIKHT